MIIPGTNATIAMAPSFINISEVKISSIDVICDSIPPVCTHIKLYGIKPANKIWKSHKYCHHYAI